MDAVHFHVREDNRTVKKAVYVAIGVKLNGKREILGMWVGGNESAKYWLSVLNEIKNRGVEDIMIVSVDVSKSYGPGLPAVNHANLHVDKGEFVFVVGSSGSGKSTLIKLLMKELDSTSGTITVSGERLEKMKHRRVAKYRRKLGVVFQDFRLLKDRNVYENVAFAQRVIGRPTRVIRKRVPEVLQEVGLAGKYKAYPDELSGGEQQRVALARALVNRPDILLADEPTGNLDPKTSEEIMALMEQINDRGTTVLVVTHNKDIVNAMRKRVVTMHNGKIISDEKEGGYHEA